MRDEMITLFYNSVSREFREVLAARVRRREDVDSSSNSSNSSSSSNNSDSEEEERDELGLLLDMIKEVHICCLAKGRVKKKHRKSCEKLP